MACGVSESAKNDCAGGVKMPNSIHEPFWLGFSLLELGTFMLIVVFLRFFLAEILIFLMVNVALFYWFLREVYEKVKGGEEE